jgi:hypothetical protein
MSEADDKLSRLVFVSESDSLLIISIFVLCAFNATVYIQPSAVTSILHGPTSQDLCRFKAKLPNLAVASSYHIAVSAHFCTHYYISLLSAPIIKGLNRDAAGLFYLHDEADTVLLDYQYDNGHIFGPL